MENEKQYIKFLLLTTLIFIVIMFIILSLLPEYIITGGVEFYNNNDNKIYCFLTWLPWIIYCLVYKILNHVMYRKIKK